MPWQPLKDLAYAVCIANFSATESQDLSIELGDHLYITEINGSWCRGWLLAPPAILTSLAAGDHVDTNKQQQAFAGVFPRTHVHVREILGHAATVDSQSIDLDRFISTDERRINHDSKPRAPFPPLQIADLGHQPLIGDIPPCVNEWRTTKLHALASVRDYPALQGLAALVDSLDRHRRDLSLASLTGHEMHRARQATTWDLVEGNKACDGQVIVRDPNQDGRILTASDDIVNLLQLQAAMSLPDDSIKQAKASTLEASVHHLLVTVHLARALPEPSMLHMYLCSASKHGIRPISEAFDVDLPASEELGPVQIPDPLSRTLFTNIAQSDVLGLDSDNHIFLVFLLSTTEPFRVAQPKAQVDDAHDARFNLTSSLGRRRRGSDATVTAGANTNQLGSRPSTANSLRSKFARPQTAMSTRKPSVTQTGFERKLKRTVGWTAIELDRTMSKNTDSKHTINFFKPSASAGVRIEKSLHSLLGHLCNNKTGLYSPVPRMSDLEVNLQAYAHDNVDKLLLEKPAQLQGVHRTPAFHVQGTQPRSDIYLTFKEPLLPYRTKLFHPQMQSTTFKSESDLLNLQMTMEVRQEDGTRIEDAIAHASNGTSHTAFRTWAIERDEAWNQTIRISLPPEMIPKAHIVMSIADGPSFPFALAWYPLWSPDSGFVANGQHHLALWDYSEHTVSRVDGKGAYQSLAAEAHDLDLKDSNMAIMIVETCLSSTFATQDPTVLEVLRVDKDSDVLPILKRFHTIPDQELSKFFIPLLRVLDGVLARDATSTQATISETTLLAFKCLTILYTLIRDFRYPHLRNLLNVHIQEQQLSPLSRLQSVKILRSLLSNPFALGRDLRAALKVADIVLKATVRPQGDGTHTDDETTLRHELVEFFDDLTVLLQNTNQLTLPTQIVVIQHFPSWLAQVQTVVDIEQAFKMAVATVDACSTAEPQSKLQRLTMIHQLTRLDMFSSEDLQERLTALTASWLSSYWPRTAELADKDVVAVRLCCTIIKDQRARMKQEHVHIYIEQLVTAYHRINSALKASRTPRQTHRAKFTPLFPSIYPVPTYTVTADNVPREVLLEIAALLGSFFQETNVGMSANVQAALSTPLDDDLATLMLQVLQSIQASSAFPTVWLSMVVSFARCQIVILRWLLSYMARALPEVPTAEDLLEFSGELWSKWFRTLSTLVTSQAVTMEYQSDQKRRAVWTIGGDIRKMAADLLQEAWQALGWETDEAERDLYCIDRVGGYQHEFTEDLVPSIVVMGLSLHAGLRTVAIATLRSMIVGLWQTSNDLGLIQSAFVDSFDVAFRQKTFEPSQAVILLQSLSSTFANLAETDAADLHEAVGDLVQSISHLVDLMSAIHTRDTSSTDAEQHIELIKFLQSVRNQDAFVRHVHDFASSRIASEDYASAALALQMHVDFNDATYANLHDALPATIGVDFPAQTVSQRQHALLSRMTHLFRLGHCWRQALMTLDGSLSTCHAQFDALGMSQVHREQAEIYFLLREGSGFKVPRHFRVVFGSAAVTGSLAGKTFIYEVGPDADTESFAKHMRRQYPSAVIVYPGAPAPKDAQADTLVKISNVNINRDYAHPVNRTSGVSPFFRTYHLSADANMFSTSTRQEKPDQLASEATVTKNVFWTREHFPTLLGRSEVYQNEELVLTPVQAAIDRTFRKTMDIAEASLAVQQEPSPSNIDNVIRLVRGSVDPGRDSVTKYRKLLDSNATETRPSTRQGRSATLASVTFDGEADEAAEDEAELLATALGVALEDHARSIERALEACLDQRPEQAGSLRDRFEDMFEPELGAIYPSGLWKLESPLWTKKTFAARAEDNDEGAIDEGTDVESDGGRRRPSWRRRRSSSIRTRLSFLGLGSGSQKDKA